MSDSEPIVLRPEYTGAKVTHFNANAAGTNGKPAAFTPPICFNRHEINRIMNVYGRKVAQGEWRDYAIDMFKDRAVFSIFRHASEFPLYRIEKDPKLARRQGAYSVITPTGHILKRGRDLAQVLRVLDKPLRLVKA
ncbi:MAG: DUF2794 domain-containing protein [Methyloligellaceae bacterium]